MFRGFLLNRRSRRRASVPMDEESQEELQFQDQPTQNQDYPDTQLRLRSNDYQLGADGSVTLQVTLDKDQVECCVCYSAMTDKIFRCSGSGTVAHNVCIDCEWEIRRTKSENGHTKIPQCPVCKSPGYFSRNKVLELHLREFSFSCTRAKKGCNKRFFPWDPDAFAKHNETCLFAPICCPFCKTQVPNGRRGLFTHLATPHQENGCRINFKVAVLETEPDSKHQAFELNVEDTIVRSTGCNSFIIVLRPVKNYFFKVICIAASESYGLMGNNQLYLSYTRAEDYKKYKNNGLKTGQLPTSQSLTLAMTRLPNMIEDADNDISTVIRTGYIGMGPYQADTESIAENEPKPDMNRLRVRVWTLRSSLVVGSVVDARDFTGRWYEAEVLKIVRHGDSPAAPSVLMSKHGRCDIKLHYLGYSSNYDEWISLDQDSHKIAQRGTFTVGPNLRTLRRIGHRDVNAYD